jgi:hypothetical protein
VTRGHASIPAPRMGVLKILVVNVQHESFGECPRGLAWEVPANTAERLRRLHLLARCQCHQLTVAADASIPSPDEAPTPIGAWGEHPFERLLFVLRLNDRRLASVTARTAIPGRLTMYANHPLFRADAAVSPLEFGASRPTLVTTPSVLRYTIGSRNRPVHVRLLDAAERQVHSVRAEESIGEVALDLRAVSPGDYLIEEADAARSPLAQTRIHIAADALPADAIGLVSIVPTAQFLATPALFNICLAAVPAPLNFLVLASGLNGAESDRIRIVGRGSGDGPATQFDRRTFVPSDQDAADGPDERLARSLCDKTTTAILFSSKSSLVWRDQAQAFALTVDDRELVSALPLPAVDRPFAPSIIRIKL